MQFDAILGNRMAAKEVFQLEVGTQITHSLSGTIIQGK
jgi:hypothetical protein